MMLGVLLVGVLWYRVVYSAAQSSASKASQKTTEAQTRVDALQQQLDKANKENSGAPSKKASLDELTAAIPPNYQLSTFLRTTDTIRDRTGVAFSSITPTNPTPVGAVETISIAINVQGTHD